MTIRELLQELRQIYHHKSQFLTPSENEALSDAIAYLEREVYDIERGTK